MFSQHFFVYLVILVLAIYYFVIERDKLKKTLFNKLLEIQSPIMNLQFLSYAFVPRENSSHQKKLNPNNDWTKIDKKYSRSNFIINTFLYFPKDSFKTIKKIILIYFIHENNQFNHILLDSVMNPSLKPLIALSNINTLPDGHLHSKISFLKSIINEEQNPEIRQMKQKVLKLSYTVKNIGIQGEEIGISSKRIPLKEKQEYKGSQIITEKEKEFFAKKYLPQNSFYSQALIPVRKPRDAGQEEKKSQKDTFLLSASRINHRSQFDQTYHMLPQTKFSQKSLKRPKFGKNLAYSSRSKTINNQASLKDEQFIKKIKTMERANSQKKIQAGKQFSNRKSFAKLLGQCGKTKKEELILPLQHEYNPLFKKIKKLQQVSSLKGVQKQEKYQTIRGFTRSTSTLSDRFKLMMSTSRKLDSRMNFNKIE